MSQDSKNDNNEPAFHTRKRKGRGKGIGIRGPSNTTIIRHRTKQRLDKLRDLRIKRLAPYLIMRDMGITYNEYRNLMKVLEREDAELLELESRDRLQTEINRYVQTADIVIAANLEIVQDPDAPQEYKQESSKIALDAAMTVVKIHSEGSRILRDVYAPMQKFIQYDGNKMPLPHGQEHREEELLKKYTPVDDSSIPLSGEIDKNNKDLR